LAYKVELMSDSVAISQATAKAARQWTRH